MEYNEAVMMLLKEGHIKTGEANSSYIAGLIQRAREDISRAVELREKYSESIHSALHNSGLALMFSEGFLPVNGKEESVIFRFAGCHLSDEWNWILGICLEKSGPGHLFSPGKQLEIIRSLIEAICEHIMIRRAGSD